MPIDSEDSDFGDDGSWIYSKPSKGGAPQRSLPVDVFRIDELDWDRSAGGVLTGDVIYSPMLDVETVCSMEVLCASHKVYFKGRPRAAYIFHCVDRKTQEVCARRLIRDIPLIPKMAGQEFFLHRPRGDATVVTADWDARHLISSTISRYLARTMRSDPSFKRIVTRGSMGKDRVDYDSAILKKFMNQTLGVFEHLRGSHSVNYRFSDFSCTAQIGFGYGVTYDLKFDEPDVMVIAEDWIERIRLSIINASSEKKESPIKKFSLSSRSRQIFEFNDTSLIWDKPCITLSSKFNSYQPRLCMSLILACICGLWSDSILLSKFNLKNIDL